VHKSRVEKQGYEKPQAILGQCPLDPEHGSLAGSLGTPHISYITSINKDKVPPIRVYVSSNKIAVNAPNTEHKRLENKTKFLAKELRNRNSCVLHTKHIYNTSITTLADQNHLLLGDLSNGAPGKMRHPLEAI
jgi:hypothetical protein